MIANKKDHFADLFFYLILDKFTIDKKQKVCYNTGFERTRLKLPVTPTRGGSHGSSDRSHPRHGGGNPHRRHHPHQPPPGRDALLLHPGAVGHARLPAPVRPQGETGDRCRRWPVRRPHRDLRHDLQRREAGDRPPRPQDPADPGPGGVRPQERHQGLRPAVRALQGPDAHGSAERAARGHDQLGLRRVRGQDERARAPPRLLAPVHLHAPGHGWTQVGSLVRLRHGGDPGRPARLRGHGQGGLRRPRQGREDRRTEGPPDPLHRQERLPRDHEVRPLRTRVRRGHRGQDRQQGQRRDPDRPAAAARPRRPGRHDQAGGAEGPRHGPLRRPGQAPRRRHDRRDVGRLALRLRDERAERLPQRPGHLADQDLARAAGRARQDRHEHHLLRAQVQRHVHHGHLPRHAGRPLQPQALRPKPLPCHPGQRPGLVKRPHHRTSPHPTA